MKKVIIAGGRDFKDWSLFMDSVLPLLYSNDVQIFCGGATGADHLGEVFATEKGLSIKYFRPEWKKHGKAAGPIRNADMAKEADVLILFWDGVSKGSRSMLEQAVRNKVETHIIYY